MRTNSSTRLLCQLLDVVVAVVVVAKSFIVLVQVNVEKYTNVENESLHAL